jgi:hypothetical protein
MESGDGKMIDPRITEKRELSNLFLVWKNITHALVASGHSADLSSALIACHKHVAIHDAPDAAFQHQQRSCPLIALPAEPQIIANSTENGTLNSEFDEEEESDSSLSSLDDTDVDDGLSIDLGPPSILIDECEDLSEWHTRSPSATFEEIFAHEESLSQCDVQSMKDDTHLEVESMSRTQAFSSPATKSSITDGEVVKQHAMLQADGPDISGNKDIPKPAQPMSATQSTPRQTTVGRLRVSDKNDLTPAQVEVVAGLLIDMDSIAYFRDNCRSMYEIWTSSRSPANNADTELTTAIDVVQSLLKGDRIQRLLLRLAYMYLAKAVDTYKAEAATERIQENADRPVGIRDATVAIDKYLKAKQKVSGELLKRSTVLSYSRTGRRWADLAGSSPLLVFIFPPRAETIVYVHSNLP